MLLLADLTIVIAIVLAKCSVVCNYKYESLETKLLLIITHNNSMSFERFKVKEIKAINMKVIKSCLHMLASN